MNILRANLKHLYQCRGLWYWYVILLFVTPAALMPLWSQDNEKFVGYLILSFFAALVVVGLQKEILSKPFSFCLPGHCKIPRRFIFIIGGVINAVFGLVFLAHTQLQFPYVLLVICAGGFMGMFFYFVGVWGMFPMRNTVALIGLLPLVVFAGGFFELYKPLEAMIIYFPVQTIIVGLLICWLSWRWLGQEGLARRYCGQMVMGIADNWNVEKFRKYREAKVVSKTAMGRTAFADRLNHFFMTKMRISGFFTLGQYIWGHVYMVIGRGLSSSLFSPWVVIVPLFMLMGYFPVFPGREDISMANFLFIVPVFSTVILNLLPYSNILLPAGRSKKYYGAITSGFVIGAVTTVLLAVVSILSVPLERILPDIVLKGHTLGYNAMNIKYCFVTLSLIPASLVVATLFPRGAIVRTIFVIMVMYAWMFFGILRPPILSKVFESGLSLAAGLIILSWAVFLMVLRYVCMRRCLVGNG
jgi:hypothetical protein